MKVGKKSNEGEDSACPPLPPCAYGDDDVVPNRLHRIWGEPRRGRNPRERLSFFEIPAQPKNMLSPTK